ncbi:DUF1998 domain-containing protein [Bacillus haynesii]|uniref:DUF1998 domain-containing protein n=1 Tax=Bacillus haynesii TaxID=1925021 RepID=UPI001F61839C|nr:DUF1998 domain-containing protein [Bacillus haynesii]MCI4127744.1 DUF1998 domain-containing protein [Bacillus haynesii]
MKNEVGEVRPGQLITTYGPGAIMDSINDSLVILDINYWGDNLEEIYDNRLSGFLRKDLFKKIPTNGKKDLPAIPFPNYHVCSNLQCRRLFDIRENFDMKSYLEKGPLCPRCGKKAYPSRFVVSCNNVKEKHLDDFPWHWWAHKNSEITDCNGELQLTSKGDDSSLKSLIVKCLKCKSVNNMRQATREKSFTDLKCTGNHPHKMNTKDKEPCEANVIPLQRGASNVYFPVLRSAISIPISEEKIDECYEFFMRVSKELEFAESHGGESGLKFAYSMKEEAQSIFDTFEEFLADWNKFKIKKSKAATDSEEINRYEQIKEIEYDALIGFTGSIQQGKDFKAEEERVPSDLTKYIKRIVKAQRLKEILALLGFTRNDIPEPDVKEPRSIVWLGDTNTNWLPAVEIFGEGIFVEFNRESLINWAQSNKEVFLRSENYKKMYKAYLDEKGWAHQSEKDVIFVLMHTLSHLLMKEMSLQCGYSSSALKERIYYNKKMSGILIYTGSSDQEGSLGGLVEMGEINNFRKLLLSSLEQARFCSNDPKCSIQEPEQDNYINGASCFACTMLPETACETGNMLLDRSLLVNTMESNITPFFEGLI